MTERESWEWDHDKASRRLQGVYGDEVRVFNKKFNHLCICLEVSSQGKFDEDYAEVLDYIDNLFIGIGSRFRKIHLNFWAADNYVEEPFKLTKPELTKKAEEFYQKACSLVYVNGAFASAIINPFLLNNNWSQIKPDLMIIFTKGQIENDLDRIQKMKFNHYRKNIVWAYFACTDEPDLSSILSIEPSSEKRIIPVIN